MMRLSVVTCLAFTYEPATYRCPKRPAVTRRSLATTSSFASGWLASINMPLTTLLARSSWLQACK